MALSLWDADEMIAACDSAGTKLAIGHQRRFAAQHLKALKILQHNEIGALRFAWISSPPPLVGWGTHVADLARYYFGDVEWLMGQIDFSSRRESPRHGECVEDMSSAYLKFTSGLRALFETESGQHRLHIFGEDGEIEVMVDGDLRIKTKASAKWVKPTLQRENPFKLEMDEMVAAIEENREHLSSGREGRAALEILMAVFESSRQRKNVKLPLEEKENPLALMVKAGEI
jgi:predicted dehydrogenase